MGYKFEVSYKGIPDEQDAYEMFANAERDAYSNIWNEFENSKPGEIHKFNVIKANDLISTWNSFITHGKANREKVEEFEDLMIENIARLRVLTALQGHSNYCGFCELKDYLEIEITEKQKEKFYDWSNDEHGQYQLSDYGLPKLEALVVPMVTAQSPERKLKVIDSMLNIIHHRGDLAAFFVQGGTKTLNQLAGDE